MTTRRLTPPGIPIVYNERAVMSKMETFILDIDYLVNVEKMEIPEVAAMMGCTIGMVEDTLCIIRDIFEETLQ
jgi:hypothetical protein